MMSLPFEPGFEPTESDKAMFDQVVNNSPTGDTPPIKRKPGRPRKNPLPADVQSLTQEPKSDAPKRPGRPSKLLSEAAAYDILYPAVSMANTIFQENTKIGQVPGIALNDSEIQKECRLLAEIPALRTVLSRADNPYLKLIAYNSVIVWQRAKLLREYKKMFDSMTDEDRATFANMAATMGANAG
jgi:hypothetical protein